MSRRDRYSIPQDVWDRRDWKEHWREVAYEPISGMPAPPLPEHSLAKGFRLHGADQVRDRDEQISANVDRLLEAYKVKPRRGDR